MKKILVRGPALSQSGYGEQCRFALRSLRQYDWNTKSPIFDIFLENLPWGKTGWVWESNEEREWIDSLLVKTLNYKQSWTEGVAGGYDMSLQVTIPNEWQQIAPVNIGYTAGIETDRISPEWVQNSNFMDRIIVVSNHAKYGFDNTAYQMEGQEGQSSPHGVLQCKTPVTVVNYPTRNAEPTEGLELELEHDFNFLCVAQWGPRKNVPNTIKWFVEEFIDKPVGLVLKLSLATNSNIDKIYTTNHIQNILKSYPQDRKCSVYLMHGAVKEEEMYALYNNPKIKALVSLTHGEGFGLPIFEAATAGLPVIAPDWSGQCDFLHAPLTNKKTKKTKVRPLFRRVDYTVQPVQSEAVWPSVINEGAMWCFPTEKGAKMAMRDVYKQHEKYKGIANKLKKHIHANFTDEIKYNEFAAAVYGQDLAQADADFDVEEWVDSLNIEEYE